MITVAILISGIFEPRDEPVPFITMATGLFYDIINIGLGVYLGAFWI